MTKSVFSLKKKFEPLLPHTMEATVKGLTDQGKSEKVKEKTKVTKTKKKKFCSEEGLFLFLVFCLFLGMFLTVFVDGWI